MGKKHLALGPDGLTLTRKATAGTPARPAATAKEGKEKDKKAVDAKPKAGDGKARKPNGAMTGASPDPMDPVNRLKILGAIDLDESRPIPAQISEAMQRSALRVMDVFKGFDTERLDGRISRNEFKRGLVALQFDVPEKYLDELFDSFDPDGSGELELNEFTKMLPATGAHARSAIAHGASTRVGRAATSALLTLRGGEEPSDALLQATYSCNQLYSSVLADAMSEVAALRKSVAGGEAVPTFGAKADEIVADACDKFEAEAPKGDAEVSAVYSSRAEELRATLVTSLEPVFVQQICLLKDAAMEQFKRGMVGDGDASESLAAAEGAFVREASASVPGKTGWSFKLERASLVGAMQAILVEQKKAQQAKLATASQMQTALSYLQMQQQQMQALQAQYMGGQGGKWNLGGAYRPPDTNINLSASYQQGRTNLQVSMVPDEGANLLGPNGFTQGVGPANLGLSFNIHI